MEFIFRRIYCVYKYCDIEVEQARYLQDPYSPLQDISTRSIMNKNIAPPYIHNTALVQVSSAKVERIFSQVKLICQTTGVSPLEETVEVRLYE